MLRRVFLPDCGTISATWAVFFVPAAILVAWAVLDVCLVNDTPEDDGFDHLETDDASTGKMNENYSTLDLLKKVFLNQFMLMFASIELAAGVPPQRDHAVLHDLRYRRELGTAPLRLSGS